jgi:hypothetical protein
MGLSSNPTARERQLANLRPQSAVKHGAYSAEHLKPIRERVLGELLSSFPNVRRDRLDLLAAQRARIVLMTDYLDTVGVIKNRARGELYPALSALQREEASYRVELSKVEELERVGPERGDTLAMIEAELAQDDDGNG